MYFDSVTNLDDLKKSYKELVIRHHPDMGGDTKTMQEINAEHDRVFDMLKRQQNLNADNGEGKETTEAPEEFRDIISKLIVIDGIDIELCGSWLWISGNTIEAKDQLKAAGCRWSRNKKMWYWHHVEDGAQWSRGRFTMDEIRIKHGSSKITYSERMALDS